LTRDLQITRSHHHATNAVYPPASPRGVFGWINRSSDRGFAITAFIFYTVFAVIAFLLEKRRAISSWFSIVLMRERIEEAGVWRRMW